jgi:hypothetical protein
VLTDMADTLAMNPLAIALLGDQTRHTGLARSAYYRWFADPAERLVYPEEDHPRHGRAQAARLRVALKTIVHPELGRIEVDGQVLFTENRAQTLVVLTTRPGTESHSKLELLSVIGHQQLTP